MQVKDLENIILLGGIGTRNFPHSKGLPHKSLQPLGDVKIIDYILQELISAGARKFTFVVSNQHAKDAFKKALKDESAIEEKFNNSGNQDLYQLLQYVKIPSDVRIKYVFQENPRGTGHALGLACKDIDSAAAMILPDDIIINSDKNSDNIYKRAFNEFEKHPFGNIICSRKSNHPQRYGIIKDGFYLEKIDQTEIKDIGFAFYIFDKAVIQEVAKNAQLLEDGGTPTTGMIGSEYTFVEALNTSVKSDENNKIRPIKMDTEKETYLDTGSIQGYEKAMIFALLQNSIFKDENQKLAKKLLK